MYPRWWSGWFIEMRVSKVPFSGSSTRTVLSKVEAMREPGYGSLLNLSSVTLKGSAASGER